MADPASSPELPTIGAVAPSEDAAPKRTRGRPRKTEARAAAAENKAPRAPGRPTSQAKLEEKMTELFVTLGAALSSVGTMSGNEPLAADGLIVAAHGPGMAEAWAMLAEENPKVKAALEKLFAGSAWTGVLLSTAGLAKAISDNHRQYAEAHPKPEPGDQADPVAA